MSHDHSSSWNAAVIQAWTELTQMRSKLYVVDSSLFLLTALKSNTIYIPNLGLLLGFGGWYNAGFPTGLVFGPGLAVSLMLTIPMGLELSWRAGEALWSHDPWDVLLSSLSGLSNSFWYYPICLFLLVLQGWLHLMMLPPFCPLLRWGAGWGWRWWWWRGGGWRTLQRGTEDSYLAARTIAVLSRLQRGTRSHYYGTCSKKHFIQTMVTDILIKRQVTLIC